MKQKIKALMYATVLLATAAANTAMAMDQGDWLIRAGASYIDPKSNNHDVVSVDSATSFTFNVSYFMTEAWAVELLAAWPFKHDIELLDGTKVGETKHLPPTLSIQYHWAPNAVFQPYVGAGLNFTTFFSEETEGPLEGVDLSLGNSWGWAAEIGADIKLSEAWFLNVNVRYMDIETKAKLDGESIGTVKIDPWIYAGNVGFRF